MRTALSILVFFLLATLTSCKERISSGNMVQVEMTPGIMVGLGVFAFLTALLVCYAYGSIMDSNSGKDNVSKIVRVFLVVWIFIFSTFYWADELARSSSDFTQVFYTRVSFWVMCASLVYLLVKAVETVGIMLILLILLISVGFFAVICSELLQSGLR